MSTEKEFTPLPLKLTRLHQSPAAIEFVDLGGPHADAALAKVYLTDPALRKRTPESLGNAQRLVDCWNACLFMSAGDLKIMTARALAARAEQQARLVAAPSIDP